jgi:sulfonate transport system ATP-binding protein
MLEITGLTKTFGNGKQAFKDLSLKVGAGEIVGVLGTSGCGKSTLLRAIAGLDRAEGSIVLDGMPVTGLSPKVGLVFQEPRLLPWLTIQENAEFGLLGKKIPRRRRAALSRRWIDTVGLGGFESHYPKECSGGMAQRASLARTLVTSPEILLLDEPFGALDAFIRMQLQDVLLEIWKEEKSTIVLVTHDIDEALYLCDRLLVLRGRPGVLSGEFVITQERPRSRGDADLGRIKNAVLNILDLNRHHDVELQYNL